METFMVLPISSNASSKKKIKSNLYFVLKWYGQEFYDQQFNVPRN